MIKTLVRFVFGLFGFVLVLLVSMFFYNTLIIESKSVLDTSLSNTKFVEIEDEQIAYSEINNDSETTVMFVGGLSAWNGTWERVISESSKTLNNKYNYVAIDLPPFGFSTPNLENNYFRDTQARRITTFIEKKRLVL